METTILILGLAAIVAYTIVNIHKNTLNAKHASIKITPTEKTAPISTVQNEAPVTARMKKCGPKTKTKDSNEDEVSSKIDHDEPIYCIDIDLVEKKFDNSSHVWKDLGLYAGYILRWSRSHRRDAKRNVYWAFESDIWWRGKENELEFYTPGHKSRKGRNYTNYERKVAVKKLDKLTYIYGSRSQVTKECHISYHKLVYNITHHKCDKNGFFYAYADKIWWRNVIMADAGEVTNS